MLTLVKNHELGSWQATNLALQKRTKKKRKYCSVVYDAHRITIYWTKYKKSCMLYLSVGGWINKKGITTRLRSMFGKWI